MYIADEPTLHLDKDGIDLLIEQLEALKVSLLVVSHDRALVSVVVEIIYEIVYKKINKIKG